MNLQSSRTTMFVLIGLLFLTTSSVYAETAEEYVKRGIANGKKGNFTQLISDCTKAIEINPNYARAYYCRGYAYYQQGNLIQAISDFTKTVEINPYPEAYYYRGRAYLDQGNSTQAISDFTKTIEICPNYAAAYYDRGHVYYKIKEYDKAWADMHKAEAFGWEFEPKFLNSLKKESRRDK